MRILIIGGNGFIGRPLVRELVHGGHEVAVLHRGADGGLLEGAAQIQGDRNRLEEVQDKLRDFAPEVIIDLILSSEEQGRQLMALASELKARVVGISSMDVYRAWGIVLGTEPGTPDLTPITEDAPLRTAERKYPPELANTMKAIFTWLTPEYDKVAVEQQIMSGAVDGSVIRLPMVYGPGDPLHRLHGVLKRISDGRPAIILPDDFAAWRGPRGYVENVAHAIALAATSGRAWGRVYNVCDEPCLTELDWQTKVAQQTDWSGRFIVLPRHQTPKHLLWAGNAAQHAIAVSKRIREELGYREPVELGEAIRRTIAWEKANLPSGPSFHQFDYEAEDKALAEAGASAA